MKAILGGITSGLIVAGAGFFLQWTGHWEITAFITIVVVNIASFILGLIMGTIL